MRRAAVAALVVVCSGAALPAQEQVPVAVQTFDAVWRIVNDTHFDTKFNGVDWKAARAEFRPKAEAAKDVGELRRVLAAMLAKLGQSHFAILPASVDSSNENTVPSGDAQPGFDVRLIDGAIIVTAVHENGGAAAAGVRPGWRLVAVAGKPIDPVIKALPESADPRIRGLQAWRMMQARLRGEEGSRVDMTFDDGKDPARTVQIERKPEQGMPVKVGSLPQMFVRVTDSEKRTPSGKRAGVIGFNVWMATVDAPFARAVDKHRSADGIIIDLRGNPGGLAAMLTGISGHFIGERKVLGTMKTRDNTLEFPANPRLVNTQGQPVQVFGGPVAILVDAMSGSASECFTGGMQSVGRVRVFGQTTMGQALPALFDKLPNGDVLLHAYADFVTGDGTRLEGRGVIPDDPTPLTRDDLLAGRDRALDAALAWIDKASGVPRK
jgi:carboxyl-terminal processing protease